MYPPLRRKAWALERIWVGAFLKVFPRTAEYFIYEQCKYCDRRGQEWLPPDPAAAPPAVVGLDTRRRLSTYSPYTFERKTGVRE